MIGVINNKYNSGFRLTFENGLTISVQIGSGNYCANRTIGYTETVDTDMPNNCSDAEIAIWDETGVYFDFGSDTVEGWVSADEICVWINRVKTATDIKSV